jgi:hypothetical protein
MASNFEGVIGSTGNDVITGDDSANVINGHLGADTLFGGGADDFIFFGAADGANVNGGEGRDTGFVVGDDAITADLAAMAMEILVGGGGADTISMGGEGDLMAAGGEGADTFVVDCSGTGTQVVWGGEGADRITVNTSAPGVMVATVAGLTAENFYLFDRSMLNLGEDFDWSQIDVLILNPDEGDKITVDYGEGPEAYDLKVEEITTQVSYTLVGEDGPVEVVLDTKQFLADTSESASYEFHDFQVGNYDQTFLTGYSGTVFTNAQVVEDYLFIVERFNPWETYIHAGEYGEFIDGEYVVTFPLLENAGLFGSGWNGEKDYEYDLSGADLSSDWVTRTNTFGEYGQQAHYFEALHLGPIDQPGGWFLIGGSLDGSEIVASGSIHADMTGITDTGVTDWLLAA